ncbi:MAG: transposase [Flavobacteriales bacterium Tduv]
MSKTRWVLEPTFGSIKRWFGSGKARYEGLIRVHANLLWRLWRIICSVSCYYCTFFIKIGIINLFIINSISNSI